MTTQEAFTLALRHHHAGRLENAEALYCQILTVLPNHADALHHLGLVVHQTGRHDLAVELMRQAIVLAPNNPAPHSNLGEIFRALGRLDEAETAYRRALALKPNYAEACNNLGIVLAAQGHTDQAIVAYRRALQLKPNYPEVYNNLGIALADMGKIDEAVASYRQAIALRPGYAEAHGNLGIALRRHGLFDDAAAAYRLALQLNPNYPAAHNNLALLLAAQGQLGEAILNYRRALALQPDYSSAYVNLGNALSERGLLEESTSAFQRALEIEPGFPKAHLGLGNALVRQGQLDKAVESYHRALQLSPEFPEAYNNLGIVLARRDRFDDAINAHRRALQFDPDYADALNNLGNALKEVGKLEEALTAYRQALAVDQDQAEIHSNLIFTLHFRPSQNDQSISEEQQRWNQQFAAPRRRFIRPHANNRNSERPLRIGYVSPDFRFHAVAFFFTPLLEAHDRERHEIYCYSNVERPDTITNRLRDSADVWRDVRGLSESELAESVRSDGIDILVDLAMHTAGNRLPAFAHRPAPVQASWLAYPGTTGSDAFDYRITDQHIDPFTPTENGSGGTAIRLPDSWCCYAPVAEFPPVPPLPALEMGFVTFGAFNQFGKVHEDLLHSWAGLLGAVPRSRLLMNCPEGEASERTQAFFAARGIASDRLELVPHRPWPEYLRLFERIDLALDTYPCNGMTTTCHALWMGVPVITRTGSSAVSGAGSSLLHTIGMREWIAQSEGDYIDLAANCADDLPRLAEWRARLRPLMLASPLMDASRFARNIESAYRTMWRHWCAEK